MKSFYFVAYLVMAYAFFVEAAKNIQISFPKIDDQVVVSGGEGLMICNPRETVQEDGSIIGVLDDHCYEDCVYNVSKNNVVCKFQAYHNDVTKYMKVTFTVKNKPTCSLTNKSKFTEVKSLVKDGKKYVESPYTAYYKFDKKFSGLTLELRRFVITVNSGCKFNADISKMHIATVKKSDY